MWGFGTGGEKSSALLLRPERKSADNHAVKACAAQQGVERCARAHDHIDKLQLAGERLRSNRRKDRAGEARSYLKVSVKLWCS